LLFTYPYELLLNVSDCIFSSFESVYPSTYTNWRLSIEISVPHLEKVPIICNFEVTAAMVIATYNHPREYFTINNPITTQISHIVIRGEHGKIELYGDKVL
jgi:hypothetical protein